MGLDGPNAAASHIFSDRPHDFNQRRPGPVSDLTGNFSAALMPSTSSQWAHAGSAFASAATLNMYALPLSHLSIFDLPLSHPCGCFMTRRG
jgi:hypothetical protein